MTRPGRVTPVYSMRFLANSQSGLCKEVNRFAVATANHRYAVALENNRYKRRSNNGYLWSVAETIVSRSPRTRCCGRQKRCNAKMIRAASRLCQSNPRASGRISECPLKAKIQSTAGRILAFLENQVWPRTASSSRLCHSRRPFALRKRPCPHSIARAKVQCRDPGRCCAKARSTLAFTLLVNRGDAASCSLAKKSALLPGLTSYLKMASTATRISAVWLVWVRP